MSVDAAMAAFRRLLADGATGGQAKVDALVALSQRTVFVSMWAGGDFRTLVNSNGQNALPIFTSQEQLEEAARQLGWLNPDGSVSSKEIGARAAFRHLVAHDLGFIIIDIAAPHTLEAERNEIEPLIAGARSDSEGPFAAVGRISETMLQVVKSTPRPMQAVQPPDALPDGALPKTAAPVTVASSTASVDATFGSGAASVSVRPLETPPDDSLLDALADVLRGYPEVEWASFFLASRGPTDVRPTVGLRVDTSYRARVQEIVRSVRSAADENGATVDALLLDDPTLVRQARAEAVVFFPWRRRPG
ncbi:MAG: SseB family protein [Myxococcota bacterium]